MALEELFVPNMPQLYGAAAQLPWNRMDFEDKVRVDVLANFPSPRQFRVHLELSTWLHRTIGKAATTRFMQVVKAWLHRARGSRFSGMMGTEISPKHTSVGLRL